MSGAIVPDALVAMLEHTPSAQRRAAGLCYSAAVVARLRDTAGLSGGLLFPLLGDVDALGALLELL